MDLVHRRVNFDSLTFPELLTEPSEAWKWPKPPFEWRHAPAPGIETEQPCRIETPTGAEVEGFIVGLDPKKGTISFRSSADGPALALPFARIHRLTLTTPLKGMATLAGIGIERIPKASEERDYRLVLQDGDKRLAGRTAGVVENEVGLFFFQPMDDDRALLRVFVPRGTAIRCELGPTAQDKAAEHWIADPQELLAAIARQKNAPLMRIGQSLVELGMVTREQVDAALAKPDGDKPLGERLVAAGLITKGDLQTAIAHKLGYPLVDLTRFPIDPQAARKLPLRLAVRHRALPILIDGQRVVVAMDRPGRAQQLQSNFSLATMSILPALASKNQILLALSSLSENDMWTERVSIRGEFFSTTTT